MAGFQPTAEIEVNDEVEVGDFVASEWLDSVDDDECCSLDLNTGSGLVIIATVGAATTPLTGLSSEAVVDFRGCGLGLLFSLSLLLCPDDISFEGLLGNTTDLRAAEKRKTFVTNRKVLS